MSDAMNTYRPFDDLFDFFIYTFLPFVAIWNYSLFKGRKAIRIRTFFNLVETNLVKYSIPFGCCVFNEDILFHHPITYIFLALMSLDVLLICYWIIISWKEPDLSIFNINRIETFSRYCLLKRFHLFYLFIQIIIPTYAQMGIVFFLTNYYFFRKLFILENALFYGITLFFIISLGIFVRSKTSCYFALTFFNFLFITLHVVLFISPNSYFTKAEVGICMLYLSNMFKLNDFCFDSTKRDDYLPIMLKHYHSLRWLFFWIFYPHHDKYEQITGVDLADYIKFKQDHQSWFVREIWDYEYVRQIQHQNIDLFNIVIEYEMI